MALYKCFININILLLLLLLNGDAGPGFVTPGSKLEQLASGGTVLPRVTARVCQPTALLEVHYIAS